MVWREFCSICCCDPYIVQTLAHPNFTSNAKNNVDKKIKLHIICRVINLCGDMESFFTWHYKNNRLLWIITKSNLIEHLSISLLHTKAPNLC